MATVYRLEHRTQNATRVLMSSKSKKDATVAMVDAAGAYVACFQAPARVEVQTSEERIYCRLILDGRIIDSVTWWVDTVHEMPSLDALRSIRQQTYALIDEVELLAGSVLADDKKGIVLYRASYVIETVLRLLRANAIEGSPFGLPFDEIVRRLASMTDAEEAIGASSPPFLPAEEA